MDLVLQAGASMRGASSSLGLVAERLGLDLFMPSYGAIRSWLLRVGCHALTCALPRGPWVWLVDHTIQIGPCKLLVIMGCLLSEAPLGARPLQQSDLRLVGLSLMEDSTQKTVAAEFERAAKRTGVPRQIVSDQGTDLIGGVQRFQAKHADIAYVHDAAHRAANVLKHRWTKDERWSAMVSRLAQTAAKLRQTRVAHLRAPTIRPQARFMNVGPTLRFAKRVLKLADAPIVDERVEIRTHGVSQETDMGLEAAWKNVDWTPGALEVANRLQTAICLEGDQAKPGEKLVGSTEVLESTFGKMKRLEGSYAGDGFTGLCLAMGAIVEKRTEDELRDALEAVPKKEAQSTIQRLLGTTVQMFRRLFIASEKA
jgi:hypothetical protein